MIELLPWLATDRALDDLRTLASLTGNAGGAQRVAWTEPWVRARRWLSDQLAALSVHEESDEAGNQWATLPGRSRRCLIIGGHLDSVPNGGWLDGALNVVSGLEILRACVSARELPLTIRLVNWADEEGRFGRSLLGSSAVAGLVRPEAAADLTDAQGARLKDVLAEFGLDVGRINESKRQIADAVAYLELHIEQGPVLWDLGLPLGVVTGTKGVRRSRVRFVGQSAHSGSTPMNARRDPLVAAARFVAAVRDLTAATSPDAVATVGVIDVRPRVPTVVPAECTLVIDQRAIDDHALDVLRMKAQHLSEQIAAEEKVEVAWTGIYDVPATLFDNTIVDVCEHAVSEVCGDAYRLPSGPLHDATAMARAGIPTGMIFVQSIGGHSHVIDENSAEDHIRLGVRAQCRAVELCLTELRP